MDTRRDPRSGEGRSSEPDLTDTGLVKIIDLQTVGDQGWRHRPIVILIAAVVGILAVVAVAAAIRPPGPSPTVPAAAIASPTPRPSTLGSISPTAPARTARPPTPRPTARPEWVWNHEELLPEVELEPMDIWSVDGRFLTLVRQVGPATNSREASFIARLRSDGGWELVTVPPAIDDLQGGAVIDGTLSFFASVGGVTPDDVRWELVSTTTGDEWASLGPAALEIDGVSFLGRIGTRWVAATWRYYSDENTGDGAIRMALEWSDDGVAWQGATLPQMDGAPVFIRASRLGGAMVVVGFNDLPDRQEHFLLSSTDGRTWRRSPLDVPEGRTPTGMACSDAACVILVAQLEDPEVAPLAIVTTDLEEWSLSPILAPVTETGGFLVNLLATDSRFLAMGIGTGYAFLSEDGLAWESLQVIVAPSGMESFVGMAVAGDDVVALVRGPDTGSPSIWSGTLPILDP